MGNRGNCKIRRNFLWGGTSLEERKIHLVNWELVCQPKKLGGLGVLDLKIFNEALLAKWYWQWISPRQQLWKSFIQIIWDNHPLLPEQAFFKQNLKLLTDFIECFTQRIPGNGTTIAFWEHNWGLRFLKTKYSELYSYVIDKMLSLREVVQVPHFASLFLSNMSDRAITEFQDLLAEVTQWAQQQGLTGEPDDVLWKKDKSGSFTVRSAYFTLKNAPLIGSHTHRIWKLNVPPRMKIFGWLMLLNRVLTIDNLIKRGWQIPNRCVMCKQACESVSPLFSSCPFTTALIDLVLNTYSVRLTTHLLAMDGSFDYIQILISNQVDKKIKELLLITQFIIWRERCMRTFQGKESNLMELVNQVQEQWNYMH